MANIITKVFTSLKNFFAGGRAKRDVDVAVNYIAEALPTIDIAAEIVTGLTPGTIDDAILAVIKTKFPKLFDGSIHTGDELKLYTLGVASQILESKFPRLDTTIARLATHLAYIQARSDGNLPVVAAPSTGPILINVQPQPKSPLAI